MYERRHQRPLPRALFTLRMLRHLGVAALLLAVSVALGMLGYRRFERLPWLDGFENSCMLLGGMGPVNNPLTPAGKLFAGCYALYAGLVFIVSAGILIAPLLHRMLHHFHYDERDP